MSGIRHRREWESSNDSPKTTAELDELMAAIRKRFDAASAEVQKVLEMAAELSKELKR